MLSSWRRIEFSSMTRQGPAIEHLYMNYPPPKKLHDYSYLGDDYRQRENIKNKQASLTRKISQLPPLERQKLFHSLSKTYNL